MLRVYLLILEIVRKTLMDTFCRSRRTDKPLIYRQHISTQLGYVVNSGHRCSRCTTGTQIVH